MLNTHRMKILTIVAVVLVQTACTPAVQTTHMVIDETRYDPAVVRYPASVGVYFPDDFFENNFYHETNDGHQHTFHNNPADATRSALELAFAKTFAEVRYLDTLQQGLEADDLAFVVVPNIVSMTADLAPEVIAVMMVYQFEFFVDGEHIHSWRVSGLDSVYRLSMQGSTSQGLRPRAISAEKFDAVARRAVWDAISVLLTGLESQSLLTGRLPAPEGKGKAIEKARKVTTDRVTLALVGPVHDQAQEPEKQRLEDCLIEEVEDNALSLRVMPLDSLRNRLYPWLSRSTYPARLNELEEIIKEPAVRERLQELGVQYVLSWDGETTRDPFEGPLYMTPYGIIGYESADKTSVVKADLLAVEDGRVVTSFASMHKGTDATLGLVWLPLPLIEDTEEEACEEIMRQVDYFIKAKAHPQAKSVRETSRLIGLRE